MKICQNCNKEFNFLVEINGKIHNLSSRKFCLECSPFGSRNTSHVLNSNRPSKIDLIPLDAFTNLVQLSYSRAEILDKLKMRKSGASYVILNRRINVEKIDISHFKQGSLLRKKTRKYSNDEIFVRSDGCSFRSVRDRILKDKIIPYECFKCKNSGIWLGEKITLELDHSDGDRYNNELNNLRFLCPNCHSQTETFCGKDRKKKK